MAYLLINYFSVKNLTGDRDQSVFRKIKEIYRVVRLENELSKKAEIQINNVTNGPIVNQYMQTSKEAVFACGNVVHVNDLVVTISYFINTC